MRTLALRNFALTKNMVLAEAYNIADLRELARKRLPRGIFEFIDRGAEDEVALAANRQAFERIKLVPRVAVDVSARSPEIELFGRRQAMPLAVAPTGSAGLAWFDGELALARAAAAAGIPYTLATPSQTSLERIAAEAGGRLWFQLFLFGNRSYTHQLMERVAAAGFEALMVTVDTAVTANREYNRRNGFGTPFRFSRRNVADVLAHPRWLAGVLARYVLNGGMPHYANYPEALRTSITAGAALATEFRNDTLTWAELRELRRRWPRIFMVKGVLHPQDALRAADCGADAVIVSNHGGRNLDSAPAPIEALPAIAEAAGHRVTVLVDSGFRRGSDVVKALALGAQAVLLGRPPLYGTAVAGERGAARSLALFREEIERVMAYIGCCSVAEISRDFVRLPAEAR